MAKILNTDGTTTDVEPANGEDFTLKEVQSIVKGYVELFDIGWLRRQGQLDPGATKAIADDDIFLVNEEGKLLRFEVNNAASILAGRVIVGPVLLCKHSQFK